MEASHSGLVHLLGKQADFNRSREFESHRLRQLKVIIKMKKIIIITISIFALVFILGTVLSFIIIQKNVKDICKKAKAEYEESCGPSLGKTIESDNHSFKEKNRAVWALGQMADEKALPFLLYLESKLPSEECNPDENICKYEVQKAIKWCKNGNITSWMYGSIE